MKGLRLTPLGEWAAGLGFVVLMLGGLALAAWLSGGAW